MTGEQEAARPLGWWLKEADARLDEAFDRTFAAKGRTRREWQVLSTLASSPTPAEDLVTALSVFASAGEVAAVVDALTQRGEVAASDGTLRLTAAGDRTHAELATHVADVRRRVSGALPQDDYVALVGLLARLVDGLSEP